jgi:hypothetical protein
MAWAPLLVVLILSLSSSGAQQPVPLELLKTPNARCLDGTQGGFYHQVVDCGFFGLWVSDWFLGFGAAWMHGAWMELKAASTTR